MSEGPSVPDARKVLDLDGPFDDKDLRRAYMRAVKRHPPEKDPDGFQVVRLAYERLQPLAGLSDSDPRAILLATIDEKRHLVRLTDEPPPVTPEAFTEEASTEPDWGTADLAAFDAWLDRGPADAWVAVSIAQHRHRDWDAETRTLLVVLARTHDDPDALPAKAFLTRLLALARDAPLPCSQRAWAALRAWLVGRDLVWAQDVSKQEWHGTQELFDLASDIPESVFRALASALLSQEWGPAMASLQSLVVDSPTAGRAAWNALRESAPTLLATLRGDPEPPARRTFEFRAWHAIVLVIVLGQVVRSCV